MNASVTSKRLAELHGRLTVRDWEIIATLAELRVANSAQLEALHFADVGRRRARRRFASLTDRRVLARLPRSVGGARGGSTGHVYALDVAGQRLAERNRQGRSRRPWRLAEAFLGHSLAVTDVYVRLALAERAGRLRLHRFTAEPASWRSFYGPGGARAVLKPDAYTALEVGGFEDHWFIEVDLDTESVPTLVRKCAQYQGYWRSGAEQARLDLFPRVLWLVPNELRAEALRRAFGRLSDDSRELFDVALAADVEARVLEGAGS